MTGDYDLIPIPAGDVGDSNPPDFCQAALDLYDAGWIVIPLLPGSKKPAVKWDPWRGNLSTQTIRRYWRKHPDHELGIIVGPDVTVFDADTEEGVIALYMLWDSLDISPNLIVETARGEHHYLRLTPGTFARSDAPNKVDHPERIDIKTGNAIAAVPPSTDKRYALREAIRIEELIEIGQSAVDAIFHHNGREAPRKPPEQPPPLPPDPEMTGPLSDEIRRLLASLDPDCDYEAWCKAGMVIQTELGGSDAGLSLFDAWSREGTKYPGYPAIVEKWRSFANFSGTPVRLGTLYHIALEHGADLDPLDEEFPPLEDQETEQAEAPESLSDHGLVPYSLRGMSGEFEAEMLEHRFILAAIAILGQWTVIYAPPNLGKTLIVIWLIIQGIKVGDIDGELLFYVNADDNHPGLTAKLRLAETHGFHMLAPGYREFRVKHFLPLLRQLCNSGRARGTVVILDTLKKFTDLMDKRTAAGFGNAVREFIAKGGTLIALAHVNKKRNMDGKPVYAGTTDIVDDADCAFVLDVISDEGDVRTVEFENIKSRGMVAKRAAYAYSTAEGISYPELLASVAPVDADAAEALRDTAIQRDEQDTPVIAAVTECIARGYTAKTQLLEKVVSQTNCSRRHAERVIDKFTGDDPWKHRWQFSRGAHGRMTFELLPQPEITDLDDLDHLDDLDDLDDGEGL